MSALIPLGQALAKDLLPSPARRQSYYNARRRGHQWNWLSKMDRQGQPSRTLWVDLKGYKDWCWATGRQLGCEQLARLDAAISAVEAAKG